MKSYITVILLIVFFIISIAIGVSLWYIYKSPINCEQSKWSECSKPCGGGIQHRSILTRMENGGTECGPDTQKCNTHKCPPINCKQSEWSECSKPCGGGIQTRTILTDMKNNGTPCGPTTRQCNTHKCSIPTGIDKSVGCEKCWWLSNKTNKWVDFSSVYKTKEKCDANDGPGGGIYKWSC